MSARHAPRDPDTGRSPRGRHASPAGASTAGLRLAWGIATGSIHTGALVLWLKAAGVQL